VKSSLVIIMIILITIFIGFGLIIPVFPVIVQAAGLAEYHLGLMLALYSAASFLTSPLWGAWSDRIGRKPIIMTGLIGFSASFFLFGISSDLPWIMYTSRILGGLFSGAATACSIAYIADITTEENRTKGMGLAGMSIGLGFIFGPAIGGLLSYFGHMAPFFAASILSLAAAAFAYFKLQESLPEPKRAAADEPKISRWTAFQGSLKYLYVISFVVSFSLAGLESTFQFFEIEVIHVTTYEIGIMFAVSGIVGAVMQGVVVRKFVKNGEESRFIQIGLIISSLGFFLILFSSSFWTAALYLAVFAAGNSLIRPCVTSLITQKTTSGQGVATGLISSMDSLGRIIGPLMGTILYRVDIQFPFWIGGGLTLMAVLLVYGYLAADRRKKNLANAQ
jgi:DHA1 family multidrug resistance protein-like MFS transporter